METGFGGRTLPRGVTVKWFPQLSSRLTGGTLGT